MSHVNLKAQVPLDTWVCNLWRYVQDALTVRGSETELCMRVNEQMHSEHIDDLNSECSNIPHTPLPV